jgi:hypothetical protein
MGFFFHIGIDNVDNGNAGILVNVAGQGISIGWLLGFSSRWW